MFRANKSEIRKCVMLSILILASISGVSQRLSLNRLVNGAYGIKGELGTNSLLYVLSECSPFFEVAHEKEENIQLVVFKNEGQLVKKLTSEDSYLLKINLSSVYCNRLVLTLAVYRVNAKTFNDSTRILVFHDDRRVECVLTKDMKWVYSKTLDLKKHITD